MMIFLRILACVLVCVLAVGCSEKTTGKTAPEGSSAAKQQRSAQHSSSDPGATPGGSAGAVSSGQPALHGRWVEVTMRDGEAYFGRIQFDGTQWAILSDVYYPAEAVGGDESEKDDSSESQDFVVEGDQPEVVLKKLGTELHQPMSFMMLPMGSVSSLQRLTANSEVRAAIDGSKMPPSKKLLDAGTAFDDVVGGRGAVFMRSGLVMFGRLAISDDWVTIIDPYYMRRKDTDDDESKKKQSVIKSLDELELVKQADASIGREDRLYVPLEQVDFIEALSGDSPVVRALSKTKKDFGSPSPVSPTPAR